MPPKTLGDDLNYMPKLDSPVMIDNNSIVLEPGVYQQLDNPATPLRRLIEDSSLYREAFQIFSNDKSYGQPYLQQLKMIPDSVATRDRNAWDDFVDFFGGTSGYDQAITDAFNSAMDEIRSLVQNYFSFKNSLPETQVEQQRAAGYNAAVTGAGIEGSDMSGSGADGIVNTENPSQSTYSNQQLSSGITSFVEFIGSMASLATTGFNAESLMGLLDIAERESYNKQEVHDLLLSNMGVTTPSPYRVLNSDNTPVVGVNARGSSSRARVASAQSVAEDKALSGNIAVNLGDNPNDTATYEIMTGEDVLNEVARFKLADQFAKGAIQSLRNVGTQAYAGALSFLEGEYQLTNYAAMIAEGNFNSDFYNNRDGVSEGIAQTSLAEALSTIRQAESFSAQFEAWMDEYKMNILDNWGAQIAKRPSLAPYFYKAMFDFDMSDTFYHQNGWTQALKYGSETLNNIGGFIQTIMGVARPKIPRPMIRRTSTTSHGPKGTTVTESVTTTE